MPNEEMLCIIRGHNILKLDKLDFTKHPMARHIVQRSILDYKPASTPEEVTPPQTEPTSEAKPKKPSSKKLYSSAKPPADF